MLILVDYSLLLVLILWFVCSLVFFGVMLVLFEKFVCVFVLNMMY